MQAIAAPSLRIAHPLRQRVRALPCSSRPPGLLSLKLVDSYDSDRDGSLSEEDVLLMLRHIQASSGSTSSASAPVKAAATTSTPTPQPAKAPAVPNTWDMQVVRGLQACSAKDHPGPLSALLGYCSNKLTNKVQLSDLVWTFLGAFLSMLALGLAAKQVHTWPMVGPLHQRGLNLLIGSFGTICVLLFCRPDAEAIKLWNFVAGHALSTLIIIATLNIVGANVLGRALAMGLTLVAMMWTDSVFPPGGALVLLAMDSAVVQGMGWWFLLYPSIAFCMAIMLPLGIFVNFMKRRVKFDWPASSSNPDFPARPSLA